METQIAAMLNKNTQNLLKKRINSHNIFVGLLCLMKALDIVKVR